MKYIIIIPFYVLLSIRGKSQVKSDFPIQRADSTSRPSNQKPGKYKDVITSKAITQIGLFKVHRIENRYFFEIPDSLFDRDMLVVNRIAKAGMELHSYNDLIGYAGDQIGENVIRFTKGLYNKIYIKGVSYLERSNDSSENGMYRSVARSNIFPIVAAFDIKAIAPDSLSSVIDVTDYLNSDNDILFFGAKNTTKLRLSLGSIQADKSYIEKIKTFPKNIEIETVKTYSSNITSFSTSTYCLNSSLILLPETPMKSRLVDERVGFFSNTYLDYDVNPQGTAITKTIRRWRLEPKDQDIEKYYRGELVEPKKPIIFYIDPSTPKKWVPYLIQGVNDWQKVFEKAGFKNAIYAREAPTKEEDSTWSLEDARYSAIVYKPSDIENAYGPEVEDPRSGEILESHVQWFHNVMQLLHDWYFVQAGAIDARARNEEFEDTLMGRLIRYVCSHEIGHTLGLAHNFISSSIVPVDSLRSKKWLHSNGICPSIMDYARFDYIAQPEDSVSVDDIIPRIGVYDNWAIEWGYKLFSQFNNPQDENKYMTQWVTEKLEADQRLHYEDQRRVNDPRNQPEDLGDNAMKAGCYGIKNLQRIMQHLVEWTSKKGKPYDKLNSMYMQILEQYKRYIAHVLICIGGVQYNELTTDQEGSVFEFNPAENQRAAVKFLQNQLFKTPTWLFDEKLYHLRGGGPPYELLLLQYNVLTSLLSSARILILQRFEANSPKKAYTPYDFLNDLKEGIWQELKTNQKIDMYRRDLQKAYVSHVMNLLAECENPRNANIGPFNSDLLSLLKGQIKELIGEINTYLKRDVDKMTKLHLIDIKERLSKALASNYQPDDRTPLLKSPITINGIEINEFPAKEWPMRY